MSNFKKLAGLAVLGAAAAGAAYYFKKSQEEKAELLDLEDPLDSDRAPASEEDIQTESTPAEDATTTS